MITFPSKVSIENLSLNWLHEWENFINIWWGQLKGKPLGSQCLTEKQLVTVLTEAVINSCPLVYVDDDINSSTILTPADFMSFHRGQVFPNVVDDPDPDPEFEVAKSAKSSQTMEK